MTQTILAFDVGKSDPTGYYTDAGFGEIQYKTPKQYYKDILELITDYKPNIVAVLRPYGGNSHICYGQGKICGIIELICDRYDIAFYDLKNDSHVKSTIFNHKKAIDNGILEYFYEKNKEKASIHTADAFVLHEYIRLFCKLKRSKNV